MAYRQVKDLLQWIVDFHEALGAQYRHLSEEHTDERLKMTLAFLADREQRMSQSVATYIGNTGNEVLDVYLLDSQEFAHPKVLERIPRCMGCHDEWDILANVTTAHQTLKDLYRMQSELAHMPEVKNLFQQLAKNQDAEARLQTRDIGRLDMY